MRSYRGLLKPGDLALVLAMILVTAATYWLYGLWPGGDGGDMILKVWIGGELVYSELLSPEEYQVEIPLPRGEAGEHAVILASEGRVRVLPLPSYLCPRHICSHVFGEISRPGENIICVPNRLVVELEGAGESEVDAVTR